MKVAAISDIHGNLPALDAVLADIATQSVDVIVNLGDILSGPLWGAATADRLMPLELPTIAGNHERQLLTLPRERNARPPVAAPADEQRRCRERPAEPGVHASSVSRGPTKPVRSA